MAEFGRMSHYDFTTANEAQRASYIKKCDMCLTARE